ncbi:hypothetical protein [Congregicoccus parvus]|uniref:hypothetical protein n=1 Tax=Congregicoccus parvus TaxID=3081749 RepID=UPI003FA5F68B
MKSWLMTLFAGLLVGCVDTPPPPPDDEVIALFEAHRRDLEGVVDLFDRYPELQIVAHRYSRPTPPLPDGLPLHVLQDIRDVLIKTEIDVGVFRRIDGLSFSVMGSGLPSGGIEKGILFSPSLEPRVENSLDGLSWHSPTGRYFRTLADGWYLYFERNR